MAEILILKLLHILAFVYWLGGDLGTFYSSKFVAKKGLSPQQRSTALTIMMGVDQGPRFCMALILGPGVHLSAKMGLISISTAGIVAVWILCFLWLGMVAAIHFGHGKPFVAKLTQFDWYFRIAVILACLYYAITSIWADGIIHANWLATKLIVFAALVACGLGIRVGLKPFIPAFGKMMQEGVSEETDKIMNDSLAKVRPFVYLIWIGLLVNAALGMHLIIF